MRQDNITMLSDTLAILGAGAYTVDGKPIALKLSPAQYNFRHFSRNFAQSQAEQK